MTRALLVAAALGLAALGLTVAGASACEIQHSASAKVDNKTTASNTHSMSTPTSTASTAEQAKEKMSTPAAGGKDG